MLRRRAVAGSLAAALMTSLALAVPAAAEERAAPRIRLRVMTFNIEYGGTVIDFDQIVKAARRSDADVIGVNEAYSHLGVLARRAGYDYWDTRLDVISRYPLIDPAGARGRYLFVQVAPGRVMAIANVHLPSTGYGPWRLIHGYGKQEVLAYEREHRLPPLRRFVRGMEPLVASGIPAVLLGDFNEPSSQDYTRATVGIRPQNLAPIRWPVSRYLLQHRFRDSFRQVHPDPARVAGLTWPAARPQIRNGWNPPKGAAHDRIDQIWTSGPLTAEASVVMGERGGPGVRIGISPWGTDHRAVISTLTVRPGVPPVMVAPSRRLLTTGSDLTVTYHAPGAAGERVVLVPAGGDPATDAVDAAPTPPGQAIDGSVEFPTGSITPGSYQAVLVDASDDALARAPIWLRAPGAGPSVSVSKTHYARGEPIVVSWTLAPGNRFDWIGIYKRDADPMVAYYKGYVYTRARVQGSATYDREEPGAWPLKPGRYTAYYLLNDSYREVAGANFRVG